VSTNGDNEYGAGFLDRVLAERAAPRPAGAPAPDAVAFDFYSRFQDPTGPPCDRFAARAGAPLCKPNAMRWCHADLGSAALRWPRFQEEGLMFGALNGSLYDMPESQYDGIMLQELAEAGWPTAHVRDACLFVHAPSPQSCAWRGGVFDDRDAVGDDGGRCLTPGEAAAALRSDPEAEEVRVAADPDGRAAAAAFGVARAAAAAPLRCLRRRGWAAADDWGLRMAYYSQVCAQDAAAFDLQFGAFYPTQQEKDAAADAAEAWFDARLRANAAAAAA
jgi:hypothetical protein